jgi:hypothetical protein
MMPLLVNLNFIGHDMTRLSFKYTKPDGSISYRDTILLSKPTDNYMTLDCSDLTEEDTEILEQRYAEYEAARKALFYEFDLHNYIKSFKATRMSELNDY